jgi:hypothetical protein
MNTPETQSGGSLKPVGSEKKCELGDDCRRPAEYVDKFGILMCAEHLEDVRAYTCGIVRLSPNDRGQARRENPNV